MLRVLIRIACEAILISTHNIFLWRKKQNCPLIITKYPRYLFHWSDTHDVSDKGAKEL